MGAYINPTNGMSKEDWLDKYGVSILGQDAKITEVALPVCLVDNGPFTAAAIAYDERELNDFKNDGTDRLKLWYMVDKKLLAPYAGGYFKVELEENSL